MAKKKQNPLYAIYKRLNTPLKINIDLKLKEQKKIFQAKGKKKKRDSGSYSCIIQNRLCQKL